MEKILARKVVEAVKSLYNVDIEESLVQISDTRKDFTGDYTLVVFPLLRFSKKSPELTAGDIGGYLRENCADVREYNVIKGFLNIVISSAWWYSFFKDMASQKELFARAVAAKPGTIMVEYSSPNTNKPLHLGHIRNNLLGYSLC